MQKHPRDTLIPVSVIKYLSGVNNGAADGCYVYDCPEAEINTQAEIKLLEVTFLAWHVYAPWGYLVSGSVHTW